MGFEGKFRIRTTIKFKDKTLKQFNHINYLGYDMSYEPDREIQLKLNKIGAICEAINRNIGKMKRVDTRLKFYKTIALRK